MKKYFFLLISLLGYFSSFSQTVIEMEKQGGVYRIPCLVNGAKMKLIFDTGAANVCLSQSIAEYLLDNDYISSADFLETGQSVVADGRIVDHLKINIKDIEIGGMHLSNVPAIVMFEQQAPLLLGQSAIQQLGTVSMNGNRLVIHKIDNNSLSDDEIDALFADAKKYCDNKMWASALECYEKLYNANVLNSWGKDSYSYLLHKNREYGKALDVIISIDDYTPFIERNYNIYRTLGNRFYFAERYKEALPYYEKAILQAKDNYEELVSIYDFKAGCNCALENYRAAGDDLAAFFSYKAIQLGVDVEFLMNDLNYKLKKKEKSVKDDQCERLYIDFLKCVQMNGDISHEQFLNMLVDLCANGQKYALQYCVDLGGHRIIKYYTK